jgi:hypothetical protein
MVPVRRIVFDVDTLRRCLAEDGQVLRDRLAACRGAGYEVILSAPNRVTGTALTTAAERLLELHGLADLCDDIVFGEPEAAKRGLHLDDKAVTHNEFLTLHSEELRNLVMPE